MLTVNTSPIAQAVVGGMLIDAGYSLRTANRGKTEHYRTNLRTLLSALDREFGDDARLSWNAPEGGFFAVLDVPFEADEELLEVSARDYGVLWTPMNYFYGAGGGERAIRLSCSVLEPSQVEEGVRRLAKLVRDRAS
jgi:(S)-3,5-dihydroxyphenylglycine transaminase